MKQKKFIIRIKESFAAAVQGTEEELRKKLESFGVECLDVRKCVDYYGEIQEDLGVLYDEVVLTETKCKGFDENHFMKVRSQLEAVLHENFPNRPRLTDILDDINFNSHLMIACDERDIVSDCVTILMESKQKYVKQKNHFVIPRTHYAVEDMNKDDFWSVMRERANIDQRD